MARLSKWAYLYVPFKTRHCGWVSRRILRERACRSRRLDVHRGPAIVTRSGRTGRCL
ncbi:hypothetical protein AB205_0188460 [Aquarana catesbeiana]|uniref:Uncharacterized protein n=1 Tax=Aquarana catesbeiana TaxID=8400 RepID=A0A2G9SDJ2_AQUCT|nr:hypothetical protein AB205_0188460 [Aquarana catesbeiana]